MKRFSALLLAALMLLLTFAGCAETREQPEEPLPADPFLTEEAELSEPTEPELPEPAGPEPVPVPDDKPESEPVPAPAEPVQPEKTDRPGHKSTRTDDRKFWTIRAEIQQNAADFKKQNPDTVGWLYLWDTTVDSPVFQRESDNDYYLKHNDVGAKDRNGALVSDYRNRLTGRGSQSQNLVIYGHSKDENPNGGVEASREYEHFTELKRWQNIDFCRAHPYFLFATPEESEVFEVFAVFHTKTDFIYNRPDPSYDEMSAILTEAKEKSLFDFNVEVSPSDRIMTLSTCCRRIVPTYPNGWRFVVMGRLVEAGKPLNYERTVTENPTAVTPQNPKGGAAV